MEMSTRNKQASKVSADSPTSDTSSVASSNISGQTRSTRLSTHTNSNDPDLTFTEMKRRRRTHSSTPTTIQKKTNDDRDDESLVGDEDNDRKSVKSPIECTKVDNKKTKSENGLQETPTKGRKRKVYDVKTAIVTRKSAMDLIQSTKRVLRCDKKIINTNKIEITTRKRSFKKPVSVTPEPSPPTKRRREDSKSDDKDERKFVVSVPLEESFNNTENEDTILSYTPENLELLTEENDSKDDELIEVVEIKQEIDDDAEDIIVNVEDTEELNEERSKPSTDSIVDSQKVVKILDKTTQQENNGNEQKNRKRKCRRRRKGALKRSNIIPAVKKSRSNSIQAKSTRLSKRNNRKLNNDRGITIEVRVPNKSKSRGRPKSKVDPVQIKKNQVEKATSENTETKVEMTNNSKISKSIFESSSNEHDQPSQVDVSKEETLDKGPNTSCDQHVVKKVPSTNDELMNENVSEINVKQFYKKHEFLENNLGIEEDPKLAEVVQNVEKIDQVNINATHITIKDEKIDIESNAVKNEIDLNSELIKGDDLLSVQDNTDDNIINFNNTDNSQTDSVSSTHSQTLTILDSENITNLLQNNTNTPGVKVLQIMCDNKNTAVVNPTHNKINNDDDKQLKDKLITNNLNEMNDELKIDMDNMEFIPFEKVAEINVNLSKELNEERRISSETTALEIDSGVSDVAENILSESNDDIASYSSLQEHINDLSSIKPKKNSIGIKIIDVATLNEMIKENQINTPKKSEQSEHSTQVINKKLQETPETLKQKENHLKSLGLLTHKAAVEAKIEKQKRRKLLQNNLTENKKNSTSGNVSIGSCSSSNSSCNNGDDDNIDINNIMTEENYIKYNGSTTASNCNKNTQEYTGTLKTVIKLNRQTSTATMNESKRKSGANSNVTTTGSNSNGNTSTNAVDNNSSSGRQSLKMTFQKGRGKMTNADKDQAQSTNSKDETYYTIQNETEGGHHQETITHGRKSYNRYHTSDTSANAGAIQENVDKKDEKENIVIPEKASSFSIHPDRLCQDQCFYCGGKFGLYDTPCHVAQLKSIERQQRILANEEKLTVDNCLCDACFRHVDRRATPSIYYRKRTSAPNSTSSTTTSTVTLTTMSLTTGSSSSTNATTTFSISSSAQNNTASTSETVQSQSGNKIGKDVCLMPDCTNEPAHVMRRKFIRKSVKKFMPNFNMSRIGNTASICSQHYDNLLQMLGCALCQRRLNRNNMYHVSQLHGRKSLEELLESEGMPIKLHNSSSVCKLCRYFVKLLLEGEKVQNNEFVKSYSKRLLNFHNAKSADTSDDEDQGDEKSENEEVTKKQEKNDEKIIKQKIRLRRKTQSSNQVRDFVESGKSSRAGTSTQQSSEEDEEENVSLPASTSLNTSITATSGQMMLDNDVMVDYDVPVMRDSPSPLQLTSKLQSLLQGGNSTNSKKDGNDDISLALRSNPNISMRELFPGEEEMGLQIKVPFGSSSSLRTPEGWTRVQTFLQYDEPTRRLWEELQKPYGNQSSFLRHLILLEKYFRNGDLILAQNASSHATLYSETVQNRLRSYDNIITPSINKMRSKSQESSEKLTKQYSNLPITITTVPKLQQNPSTSNSNNNNSSSSSSSSNSNSASASSSKNSLSIKSSSGNMNVLKANLLHNKNAVEIVPVSCANETNSSGNHKSTSEMTKQQKLLEAASKLISNNEKSNTNQITIKKAGCSSNNFLPELISINRGPNKSKQIPIQPKPVSESMPEIIVLPETLTPLERMQSKNWRPTLVPITPKTNLKQTKPLYQTVDGRHLPALVQVQSSGRPYLISIHDYNRMCILRREKLMHEQLTKNNQSTENSPQQLSQMNKVKIPNAIFEQNSLIPVSIQNCLQNTQISNQKNKKFSQNMIKTSNTILPMTLIPIAPKTSQQTHQLSRVPLSIASSQHALILGQALSQNNSTTSANMVSTLPELSNVSTIALPSTSGNTSRLWTTVSDSTNSSINGDTVNVEDVDVDVEV